VAQWTKNRIALMELTSFFDKAIHARKTMSGAGHPYTWPLKTKRPRANYPVAAIVMS
jgi:hypothetical protein